MIRNERDVKREVKKILNKYEGLWWFMPVQMGFGRHGIPDFIVCYKGKFLAIETKFGKNKLTARQRREKFAIGEAKGLYLVINERNLDTLREVLDALEEEF